MKNKKYLGQHWLKERLILETISDLAYESPNKPVSLCVEIGPGLGTLTSSLLRRFNKVIAVEYDEQLANNLPKSFPGKNLTVFNMDFLKFDLSTIEEPYIVAGNIPYYITSPIIEKLLKAEIKPEKIVLLIQKEVADRIAAKNNLNSIISLFCQNYAKVSLGPIITKEYFTPPPKVDSEVIIFEPLKNPLYEEDIFTFIKTGFSAPRKKLLKNITGINNFSKEDLIKIMNDLKININARPSDLRLKEWVKLAEMLKLR